MTQQTMPFPMT